jgi:hypothetical protein
MTVGDRCLDHRRRLAPAGLPPTADVYDQITSWLTPPETPYLAFETTSLLVSAITAFKMMVSQSPRADCAAQDTLLGRWQYVSVRPFAFLTGMV